MQKSVIKFSLARLPLLFAFLSPFFFLGLITLGVPLICLKCEWRLI